MPLFNSTLLKVAILGASVAAIRTTLVSELQAETALQSQTECMTDDCQCGCNLADCQCGCNLADMCDCCAEKEEEEGDGADLEHAQVEQVEEKSLMEINEEIT